MRFQTKSLVAVATVSIIFVTGCSNTKSTTVSPACTEALAGQATAIVDMSLTDEQANNAERPALNACKDSTEWLSGVKANPASIGFTETTQETAESGIITACLLLDEKYSTPVCSDAKQKGLLD